MGWTLGQNYGVLSTFDGYAVLSPMGVAEARRYPVRPRAVFAGRPQSGIVRILLISSHRTSVPQFKKKGRGIQRYAGLETAQNLVSPAYPSQTAGRLAIVYQPLEWSLERSSIFQPVFLGW